MNKGLTILAKTRKTAKCGGPNCPPLTLPCFYLPFTFPLTFLTPKKRVKRSFLHLSPPQLIIQRLKTMNNQDLINAYLKDHTPTICPPAFTTAQVIQKPVFTLYSHHNLTPPLNYTHTPLKALKELRNTLVTETVTRFKDYQQFNKAIKAIHTQIKYLKSLNVKDQKQSEATT